MARHIWSRWMCENFEITLESVCKLREVLALPSTVQLKRSAKEAANAEGGHWPAISLWPFSSRGRPRSKLEIRFTTAEELLPFSCNQWSARSPRMRGSRGPSSIVVLSSSHSVARPEIAVGVAVIAALLVHCPKGGKQTAARSA